MSQYYSEKIFAIDKLYLTWTKQTNFAPPKKTKTKVETFKFPLD